MAPALAPNKRPIIILRQYDPYTMAYLIKIDAIGLSNIEQKTLIKSYLRNKSFINALLTDMSIPCYRDKVFNLDTEYKTYYSTTMKWINDFVSGKRSKYDSFPKYSSNFPFLHARIVCVIDGEIKDAVQFNFPDGNIDELDDQRML